MNNIQRACAVLLASLAGTGTALAVNFEGDVISGSFDSTISIGAGVRLRNPSPGLIQEGNVGGPAGQLSPYSGINDQGTLNYGRGDLFTQYLKGSHELLLKLPEDFRFMARVNWLSDFAATRTTGWLSSSHTTEPIENGLSNEARSDLRFKARMLDLWVSKSFDVAGHQVRARVGNQVINWGESLFQAGGINATNAFDVQRLSQPGTQLKEAVLPAPMVSVAASLGGGVNVEGYVQARWNGNYFAPVGSYWSSGAIGKGEQAYGLQTRDPRKGGQWGVSLKFQPSSVDATFGIYVLNYHDKTPNFTYQLSDESHFGGWAYAEDRKLYGVSASTAVGGWALGTELSYRPKDAVSLNSLTGCGSTGNCWVDSKRFQWHGTAMLSLTPDNARDFLHAVDAQTGTLLFEAVGIYYPSLRSSYNDGQDFAAAGGWGWGFEPGGSGLPSRAGTKFSAGYNLDFSLTYDGTLLPGWQVTPGIYFFHAVTGRTPNITGQFMQGAKSANLYLSFVQNPADWQLGLNYGRFWGGHAPFDQAFKDRTYLGAYVSRSF